MIISEENLRKMITPASNTEENKCDTTIKIINRAIDSYGFTSFGKPKIIPRGSYENNTNVKRDSDIDVYALFENYYHECDNNLKIIPPLNPSPYKFSDFRNKLYTALCLHFDSNKIINGNKSIKINSIIDADVVPVINLKCNGKNIGVSFISMNGDFIVNFLEQDKNNGILKNKATGNKYKWFVRIFKTIRNNIEEIIYTIPKVSSYTLESLLYNIPNEIFLDDSYMNIFNNITKLLKDNIFKYRFYEVNECKEMFRKDLFPEQRNTREEILCLLNFIINNIPKENY